MVVLPCHAQGLPLGPNGRVVRGERGFQAALGRAERLKNIKPPPPNALEIMVQIHLGMNSMKHTCTVYSDDEEEEEKGEERGKETQMEQFSVIVRRSRLGPNSTLQLHRNKTVQYNFSEGALSQANRRMPCWNPRR